MVANIIILLIYLANYKFILIYFQSYKNMNMKFYTKYNKYNINDFNLSLNNKFCNSTCK